MSKQPSQEKNASFNNSKGETKEKQFKLNCSYCNEEIDKSNKSDCTICKKCFCQNCVSNEKSANEFKKKSITNYICTSCLSNPNSAVNRKRNKKDESFRREDQKGLSQSNGENYEEYNSDFDGGKNADSLLSISISMEDKEKSNKRLIEEMDVDDGILDIDNLQMIVTPPSELYDYQEVMKKRKKYNIKSKDENFNSKQGNNIIKIHKQSNKKSMEVVNYSEDLAPVTSSQHILTKRKRKINIEKKIPSNYRPEVKPVNFSSVAQYVECHQCKRDCPLSTVLNCLNKVCNKSYCIDCTGKYSKSEVFGECYSCKKVCTCNDCKLGITSNNNLNQSKSKHVVEIDDFFIIENNDDQDSEDYAEKENSEEIEEGVDEGNYEIGLHEEQPQPKAQIQLKVTEAAPISKIRVPQEKINPKINKFKTSKKEDPPTEPRNERPSTANDLPVMTFKLEKSVVESLKLSYFENQTKVEQIIQRVSNNNLNSSKSKTKRDCFICKTTKHITQFKLKCFTDFMVFLHNHYVNVAKVNHKDASNENLFNNVEWMKHYYNKYFLKSYSDNSQSYKTVKHLCVACLDKKMNSENGFFDLYNIMLTMNFKSEFYPKSLNNPPVNNPPAQNTTLSNPLPPNSVFNTMLEENLSFFERGSKANNSSAHKSEQTPSQSGINIGQFNLMNLANFNSVGHGQKSNNEPNLSNLMSMVSNLSQNAINNQNNSNQSGEGQKLGASALGLIGNLGLKNIEGGAGLNFPPAIKLPSNLSNPILNRLCFSNNQQGILPASIQGTALQPELSSQMPINQQSSLISSASNITQKIIPPQPSSNQSVIQTHPDSIQSISQPLQKIQEQPNTISILNNEQQASQSNTPNVIPNLTQFKTNNVLNINSKVPNKGIPNQIPNIIQNATNVNNPAINISNENKNNQMIYLIINQILQQRSNSMLTPNSKPTADHLQNILNNPANAAIFQSLSQKLPKLDSNPPANSNLQTIQAKLQSNSDQSNFNLLGEVLKHAGGSQSQPVDTASSQIKAQAKNDEHAKNQEKVELSVEENQIHKSIEEPNSGAFPQKSNNDTSNKNEVSTTNQNISVVQEIGKEQANLNLTNQSEGQSNSKNPILEHFKFKTTLGPGVAKPKSIFNNTTVAPKMEVDDIKVENRKEKVVSSAPVQGQNNLSKEQNDKINLAEANKNNKNMSIILDELKKQFFSIQYFSLLQKLFISYIFKNLELYVEQMFKYHVLSEIVTNYIITMTQDKDKAVVDYIKYLKTITSIGSNLSNALNSNIQGLKSNGIKTFKSLEDSLKSNMKSVIDNFGEAYTTINSDGIKDETKNALLNGMNDIKNLNMSYTSHFTSQLNPLLNILFNKKEEEKKKTENKEGHEPSADVKQEANNNGNLLDQNLINEKLKMFLQDKNNMKNIGLNLNNMMSKIGASIPMNLKKELTIIQQKSEVIQANFDASSEIGLCDKRKKGDHTEIDKANNLSKENRRPSDIESSFDENFSEREDDNHEEDEVSEVEKLENKNSTNLKEEETSKLMELENQVIETKEEANILKEADIEISNEINEVKQEQLKPEHFQNYENENKEQETEVMQMLNEREAPMQEDHLKIQLVNKGDETKMDVDEIN